MTNKRKMINSEIKSFTYISLEPWLIELKVSFALDEFVGVISDPNNENCELVSIERKRTSITYHQSFHQTCILFLIDNMRLN